MKTVSKYSPEFRERAVRMVFEHQGEHPTQWAAIVSIAGKLGCTGETLRKCVRQAERDQGRRDGVTSSDRDRLKQLEREVRELGIVLATELLRSISNELFSSSDDVTSSYFLQLRKQYVVLFFSVFTRQNMRQVVSALLCTTKLG